jgi:SpoVK/Ycf46/Vps4 family AAA+-type ATPase
MYVTGLRALRLAPKLLEFCRSPATDCHQPWRCFHSSSSNPKPPPGTTGSAADENKASDKSTSDVTEGENKEQKVQQELSTTENTPVYRTRREASAASRNRYSRTRSVEDFPPVNIAQSFLENNVSLYGSNNDSLVFKQGGRRELEGTITPNDNTSPARLAEGLWQDLTNVGPDTNAPTNTPNILYNVLERIFRAVTWDEQSMSKALQKADLNAIRNRCNAIGEAAQWMTYASDFYMNGKRDGSTTLPYENIQRAFPDPLLRKFMKQQVFRLERSELTDMQKLVWEGPRQKDILSTVEGDSSLLRSIPELSPKVHAQVKAAIEAELLIEPSQKANSRDAKRPVTVLTIPNYKGDRFANSIVSAAATSIGTDIIRLDAQDLAMLIGEYLGQDWAYSRGPFSMLGFSAAEVSGKTGETEDAEEDPDSPLLRIRQVVVGKLSRSPLEQELQKIKGSAKEYMLSSVDKWDNLKINAVLEEIVRAAELKAPTRRPTNLIIHVHDFVELNMTLEGALVIGRLRTIIDNLWRDGKKITLVGTSSYESPSEQYLEALQDITTEDCVITCPLNFADPEISGPHVKELMEANDFLQQNIKNIAHMAKNIGGRSLQQYNLDLLAVEDAVRPEAISGPVRVYKPLIPESLTSTILPLPDLYHVARVFVTSLPSQVAENAWMLLLRLVREAEGAHPNVEKRRSSRENVLEESGKKSSSDPEIATKDGAYNEYEKKLMSGLVDSKQIKTTFADVHAPAETIAALRLLTSLSLVRPEAFSYGVLATERITGCLLYGPPGTGKTLLAKAVAKESAANMLEVSGASINDMFVGQSEKNVRAVFSLAKKLSPMVVFIDEADALLASRSGTTKPAYRETINQFLREWDGMSDTKAFIMVATNRPFDLDDAVLRRLPRKILVDLPLQPDREAIISLLLKDEQLDDSISLADLSSKTSLYSGSDLKNLCVAAAMAAVQEENEEAAKHSYSTPYVYPVKRTLQKRHFDKALREIGASISEDMDTLKAIRKFDEKHGNLVHHNKKRQSLGFGILPATLESEEARVRRPVKL